MSDSEKTDELDNYGVWVKKGPQTVDSSASSDTDFSMDMNLPDFSELDVPDDNAGGETVDVTESFLSDLDTDLSDITGAATEETPAEVPEATASEASGGETEDISLDEFITDGAFTDVAEGNRGYGQSDAPAPAPESAPAAQESSGGEESISLDDFLDGDVSEAQPVAAAPAAEQDEAPLDIDLSFDDSTDSLVTETEDSSSDITAEFTLDSPSSALGDTESIDLSEFGFDGGSDEGGASSAPAQEAVADTSSEGSSFDDMFNNVSGETEIDASSFFDDSSEPAPKAEPAATEASASSGEEEVDLSDFGFDDSSLASQGEVKDETKTAAPQSVDYEMNVMADDDLPQTIPAEPVSAETEESPVIAENTVIDDIPAPEVITEEEIAVTEQAPAVEDIAIDDIAVEEPVPTVDEISLTEAMPAVEEFSVEEPTLTEEVSVADELPSLDDLSIEEPIATEEVAVADDLPVSEDIPVTEEFSIEEETVADDIPIPEELPDIEGFAIEEPAEPEAAAFAEEPAIPEDIPATEEFAVEEPAATETAAFTEETPVAEPVVQEAAPVQETAAAQDGVTSPAATAILSQIVGELTSLKNEIAGLKNDFEEMRNRDVIPTPVPEQKDQQESTGFFDASEEDDTIALSTDELANIMNTADFDTETVEANADAEVPEESAEEQIVPEEIPAEEEESDALSGDDTLSTDELANIVNTADFSTEEGSDSMAEENEVAEASAEPVISEEAAPEGTVEEPAISETPAEVAEGEDDFILPESTEEEHNDLEGDNTLSTDELANIVNTADFSTEEGSDSMTEENEVAETSAEPVISEEAAQEAAADDFNFDAIEDDTEEALPEEISVPKQEEPISFDAEPEIAPAEPEPADVTETAFAVEEAASEPAMEVEEPVSQPEPVAPAFEAPASESAPVSGDLKNEIKSVLSYMDKLLENLPEDKIAEFAQSEQFETYKKLFKELGLA